MSKLQREPSRDEIIRWDPGHARCSQLSDKDGMVYQLLVDCWAISQPLKKLAVWMIYLTLFLSAGTVYLFYARRVHIISGTCQITFSILICSLPSFCGSIDMGIANFWVNISGNFLPTDRLRIMQLQPSANTSSTLLGKQSFLRSAPGTGDMRNIILIWPP
ncbi:hypothetical protein FIBSPDRAFT_882823 [Athelia psychrophila]|uniref:Uncharacterized protein n=1 Tax=Athelia psychrophila TaxID=1759441 RepID=A0A166UR45_9AGAM|nr:hypothetical protein FIBSPDRAFT_882823 [Fibularhizoctonia sp. CBS 109695]